MKPAPAPVPWMVIEAVALQVARLQPRSVRVVGDVGDRLGGACLEAATDESALRILAAEGDEAVDVVVWAGHGDVPVQGVRHRALALARGCAGDIVRCEPLRPGHGLGLSTLRRLDPGLQRIETDEVPDGRGGTRRRRIHEPPARWAVARVAAWRLAPDAEAMRAGFISRLPRMSGTAAVMACRRLRQRFESAWEPFAFAAEELARRGDVEGVRTVQVELALSGDPIPGVVARVRRARVACGPGPNGALSRSA